MKDSFFTEHFGSLSRISGGWDIMVSDVTVGILCVLVLWFATWRIKRLFRKQQH